MNLLRFLLTLGTATAVVGAIVLFNRLVHARVRVDEALAQIDAELQRRHDLVGQLAAAVDGAASHERDTIAAALAARTAALAPAPDQATVERTDARLRAATARLLAVAERYPELRTDEVFRHLQQELADTESRLAFARDFAVHRVATYEQLRATFPSWVVARLARFTPRSMFAADDAARAGANVDPHVTP